MGSKKKHKQQEGSGDTRRTKPSPVTAGLPDGTVDDAFTSMELDFFKRAEDLYATEFETWDDFDKKRPS